jgi:hypothetical protein
MHPLTKHSRWLALGLSIGACHAAPEPPPAPAAAASSVACAQAQLSPHQSPLSVTLKGPSRVRAGQDIELFAEVEQHAGSQPVQLSLELPEGTRLVSGSPAQVLPGGSAKLQRRFVVHVERVPGRDIELLAATDGASFGARARGAYRFGRPEPRFAEPPRAARPLMVGGKNLGRPIELRPSK